MIKKRITLIDRVVALMEEADYMPFSESDYWAIVKNVAKCYPNPTDEDIKSEIDIYYNNQSHD